MNKSFYVYPWSYLSVVIEYIFYRNSKYGKNSTCFEYNSIMGYAYRNYKMSKTTIERAIRRLAQDKWIVRVRERPRAIFCIEDVDDVIKKLANVHQTTVEEYIKFVKEKIRSL